MLKSSSFVLLCLVLVGVGIVAAQTSEEKKKSEKKAKDTISINAGGQQVEVSGDGKVKVRAEGQEVDVDGSAGKVRVKSSGTGEADDEEDDDEPMGSAEENEHLIEISGMDQVLSFDCNGRDVEVGGSSNRVTLRGECPNVEVNGIDNVVFVDAVAAITVHGIDHRVQWKQAIGAKAPRINRNGTGHSIVQAKN